MQLRQPAEAPAEAPVEAFSPVEAKTGEKRKAGRPPGSKNVSRKAAKLEVAPPLKAAAPVTEVQAQVREKKAEDLPNKTGSGKPLPTLSEPQSLHLSNDEYQSIANSAVLAASLDRSRNKWLVEGLFQRYWTKPEKNKPPPPDNPEFKWMKHKGPCKIRIEPHIFDAEVFVEERVKLPKPVYAPPPVQQSAYGQPYRTQPQSVYQQQHQAHYQHRTLPAIDQSQAATYQDRSGYGNNKLPPINQPSHQQQLPPPPPQPAASRPQQAPAEKKASPDPVISMLASRASSDPELKALMKEVATGGATQEQLKIFQKHIDELTNIIQERKRREEEAAAREAAKHVPPPRPPPAAIPQYDGTADGRTGTPQQQYYQHQPSVYPPANQQPAPSYIPPTPPSVILAFTTPGSTEDRFLFPQHSILEFLSPTHTLASFIITRKGHEAADPTGLERHIEYWQPVTMLVESEEVRVLQAVQRWVKPPNEVQGHMKEIMARCTRAPVAHLAMRLPFKSTVTEDVEMVDSAAPVVIESKPKPKAAPKVPQALKKTVSAPKGTPEPVLKKQSSVVGETPETKPESSIAKPEAATSQAEEGGRPRRATRQNVRFSDA